MVAHLSARRRLARADSAAEERLFRQALAIQREIGDQAGTASRCSASAWCSRCWRGDWAAAMPLYREALILADSTPTRSCASEVHRHLGFYYSMWAATPTPACATFGCRRCCGSATRDPRRVATGTLRARRGQLAAGNRLERCRLLARRFTRHRPAGLSAQRVGWAEQALRDAEGEQQ